MREFLFRALFVICWFSTAGAATLSSRANTIESDPCKMEYWGCMDSFCIIANNNGARCACSNDIIRLDKEYAKAVGAEESSTTSDSSCDTDDISCKTGAAKLSMAAKLCESKASDSCKSKLSFNKLQYSQNVRNDCNAYSLIIKDVGQKQTLLSTQARLDAVDAAKEQFDNQNKMNSSECVVALKSCMNGDDACGKDWTRCTVDNIADKRMICEKVLNHCVTVKENVWNGFVADITPTLKSVVLSAESNQKQNCIGDISNCIVKACKDNITGTGETIDGCLARPEMARSFCKVELDRCDANENLWTYVKQKLAAMRSDRCAVEVRDCLTSDNICGKDFSGCIGMDLDTMHKMCPLDKLVVCKQANANFSLSDVDNLIYGIFLSMDTQLGTLCNNLLTQKVDEVCEGAADCAKAFSGYDQTHFGDIDWGTLRISDGAEWISCKTTDPTADCDKFPQAGVLLVDGKVAISPEIKSVQNVIDVVINSIESDQKISWCIGGRSLSQIGGDGTTMARFPIMTQGIRSVIASSAISAFSREKK